MLRSARFVTGSLSKLQRVSRAREWYRLRGRCCSRRAWGAPTTRLLRMPPGAAMAPAARVASRDRRVPAPGVLAPERAGPLQAAPAAAEATAQGGAVWGTAEVVPAADWRWKRRRFDRDQRCRRKRGLRRRGRERRHEPSRRRMAGAQPTGVPASRTNCAKHSRPAHRALFPRGGPSSRDIARGSPEDAALATDAFHSGKMALKSSSKDPGQSRIQKSLSALGATASKHWGRVFYKVQSPATKPATGVLHVTFLGLMGTSENVVVNIVRR